MNLREQILQADDLKTEKVDIPEWDTSVYVRVMPGVDRDAFEVSCTKDGELSRDNFRARLAVWTVVDEAGVRVFGESDAELLGSKSGTALGRVFDVATRINRMTKADVEELSKNSQTGPGAGSHSA